MDIMNLFYQYTFTVLTLDIHSRFFQNFLDLKNEIPFEILYIFLIVTYIFSFIKHLIKTYF